MEEKKNPVLKVEKEKKEKSTWTPKKIITTIIIAVLALLMVGGLYYVIAFFQQSSDDSNVFGYYDGEPIKYEANTVFYNTLVGNPNYQTAYASGDLSTVYGLWAQAYQQQVVVTALMQLANKANIVTSDKLVDKLVIESGVYSSEDGSKNFDEEVYKATNTAERTATYNNYKNLYPYFVITEDMQTALSSEDEKNFILDYASEKRSFDYYVVDYNAYPDDLALSYDISGMEKEEGKEPSLSEIKQYIYSVEPDTVKPYIELAIADASSKDFYTAASSNGNKLVTVSDAVNNIGGSSLLATTGIEGTDSQGLLASVFDKNLAKELFTAEKGYETAPIATETGYIVVKVTETEAVNKDNSWVELMYAYTSPYLTSSEVQASFLGSDKFDDHFMEKFLPLLLGSSQY